MTEVCHTLGNRAGLIPPCRLVDALLESPAEDVEAFARVLRRADAIREITRMAEPLLDPAWWRRTARGGDDE